MKTLNEIVKKVNSLKKQLQNKQVGDKQYENFMGKLDDFIGDIYEYDYHRRQSIFEIKEDFFNWCRRVDKQIPLALARKYSRHATVRPAFRI
jgi:hypothetical protein